MGTRTLAEAFGPRTAVAALLLVLLPASAMADRHKASFGGGGVLADRSSLYGVALTGDATVWEWKRSNDLSLAMLSVAGEASRVSGEHEGQWMSQYTFLLGPRFVLNTPLKRRVEPYLQVMAGFVEERAAVNRTSFAYAVGAGVDVPIGDLKPAAHPLVVFRFQYGRHRIDAETNDSYDQWSVGVVFRFNRHDDD